MNSNILGNGYHAPAASTTVSTPTEAYTMPMPEQPYVQQRLNCTYPVPLSALDRDSHICPICHEPYAEHNPIFRHPEWVGPEYPVRVVSRQPHSKCQCVFGVDCIRRVFRSMEPWCNKCPLCREIWFPTYDERVATIDAERNARDAARSSQAIAAAEGLADAAQNVRVPLSRQRSRVRIHEAPEVVPMHDAPQVLDLTSSRRTSSSPMQGLSNRGRMHRSVGFLERTISEFDIDDRDAETTNMVAAIEMAVEDLWQRLETSRRVRDERNPRAAGSPSHSVGGSRRSHLRHREF
ncbi:hypothetical protein BDV96DRAFT_604082 [Lophiotrema nucula]|uniref:RING-type domain-containing protein n=1 Tax=Lophiotrema nucula TaxID=690887 RepID=A0A6A5YWL0_9PLEO|nr:hypothetical protein BDV96DRAFT_604082 [Lophiotrema nucula]